MEKEEELNNTIREALSDPEVFKVPTGITRYDFARTHCWWVRINRDRTPFSEHFYDGECNGYENGLILAIKYRHELITTFPVTVENTYRGLSSIPEERVSEHTDKDGEKTWKYWQARYYDKDFNIKRKNFSMAKLGTDRAKELAIEWTTKYHNYNSKPGYIQDIHADHKWRIIPRSDVEILSKINCDPYGTGRKRNSYLENTSPFTIEGAKSYQLHLKIERDKSFRKKKLNAFLDENGMIYCELCFIQFTNIYKFLLRDIIEIHHIFPLSKLDGETIVKLNDLVLLCPNCHTAIHCGDAVENFALAKQCLLKLDSYTGVHKSMLKNFTKIDG